MHFSWRHFDSNFQYCGPDQVDAMAHFDYQPFRCDSCHLDFRLSGDLQRHNIIIHGDVSSDDTSSESEVKTPHRLLIACVACARAKTKCDKTIPSCSRCLSKGILCEARCTKRASDAATRFARKQFSLYRRPVPIMSANRLPPPQMTNSFPMRPDPVTAVNGWEHDPMPTWAYGAPSPMTYPYTPPNSSTQLGFQSTYLSTPELLPTSASLSFAQPLPSGIFHTPAFLSAGAVQPITSAPAMSITSAYGGRGSDLDLSMSSSYTTNAFEISSNYGDPLLAFDVASERSQSVPTPQPTPDFSLQVNFTGHMEDFGPFS